MPHLSPNARRAAVHSRLTTDNSLLSTHASQLTTGDSRLTTSCFKFFALAFLAISLSVSSSTAADTINYDTAWTFVYNGGKKTDSTFYGAIFSDVKPLANGACVCAGASGDSTNPGQSLLLKLDATGRILQKKLYSTNNTVHSYYNTQATNSIVVAKNGDFILGGKRWLGPWVMRLDSAGNLKWGTWYYDSTKGVLGNLLQGNGAVNCVRETSRGSIICAAGDYFTDNGYVYGKHEE